MQTAVPAHQLGPLISEQGKGEGGRGRGLTTAEVMRSER